VLLDDPLGVLRSGRSVLMSWDFGTDQVVDAASVRGYVADAVAKYDQYKATAPQVLEASRAAAKAPGPAGPDAARSGQPEDVNPAPERWPRPRSPRRA
jgi:hypothetical protein